MKALLIAVAVLLALYLADQHFAHGKYSYAVGRIVTQMRHSFGV
ncbi:hypothetical protein ACFFWD_18040 [Bradyrhizobium erythrophlei]